MAGENDTLPEEGLRIGNVRVLAADAADAKHDNDDNNDGSTCTMYYRPIRLYKGRNGWGTGVHPTTRLCLEWICRDGIVQDDGTSVVLDYGCGSGILSIAALHAGASKCIGVDVEAEALVTAERNVALNGYGPGRFEGLHTREVLPGQVALPAGADVCVANILVGQLVRPSMVAAIVSNLACGAWLCLSGIRPGQEVEALKRAYGGGGDGGSSIMIEWDETHYAELSASETENSIESYGFDCGRWARLVGRKTTVADDDNDRRRAEIIERMSEQAVS